MKIISLKFDFSMKEVISNPLVRKHLISDVTGIPLEEIRTVHLANSFLWKRRNWEKQGILDLLLEMNDDTKINIELQVAYFSLWDRRNLFYLAKMFTEDLKRGERYDKLKRCICISILDFKLTDSPKYHSVYRLRDEDGNEFSDMFEIHIIELCKKLNGNEKVDDWIRLFNAETEEDLDMIKTKNPGLQEAIREVKVMSFGKRMHLRYEAHLKEVRDRKAREDYVRQQGIELGTKLGTELGVELGAEKMLMKQIRMKRAKGLSIAQIAEALEETPEHISELIEKMDDI